MMRFYHLTLFIFFSFLSLNPLSVLLLQIKSAKEALPWLTENKLNK